MIEYYAWAMVSDSPVDDDVGRTGLLVDSIRPRLDDLTREYGGKGGCEWINGAPRLWIVGAANHGGQHRAALVEFFRDLGARAPGSYGLLWIWDDEDPNHGNEFVAWVLKRGTLTKAPDPYLSPCLSTIEDRV